MYLLNTKTFEARRITKREIEELFQVGGPVEVTLHISNCVDTQELEINGILYKIFTETNPTAGIRRLESKLQTAKRKLALAKARRPMEGSSDRVCAKFMAKIWGLQNKIEQLEQAIRTATADGKKRTKSRGREKKNA